MVLIFASNILRAWEVLYIPYVAAIAAQVAVIFYYFLALRGETGGPQVNPARRPKFAMGFLCGFASTLGVGVVAHCPVRGPCQVRRPPGRDASAYFCPSGFLSSWRDAMTWKHGSCCASKMRLLSVAVGTLAAFGLTRIS